MATQTASKRSTKASGSKAKAKAGTKAKASTKAAEPKAGPAVKLNGTQRKVLEVLADGKPKTRKDLKEATGLQKGWSKILGAPTKGELKPTTLEGMGLVKSEPTPEGLAYTITAAGKQALAS
jgi:hypothetical protein